MNRLSLRDPAEHRRVVVRTAEIRVPAVKGADRVQQQLSGREEASRSLRKAIEVLRAEARLARIVEVVAPRQLGDQPPEGGEEIAVRVDVDVRSPKAGTLDAVSNVRESVGVDPHATVEEQRPFALRRLEPCPARFETAAVRLGQNADRHAICSGGKRDLGAAVGRAVIDHDDLGLESTVVQCGEERVDGVRQLRRLVEDGDDDTQGRLGHGNGEPYPAPALGLPAMLMDLLRCPTCRAAVAMGAREAVCRTNGHRFPVADGVVVMIGEEELRTDPQYDRQRQYFDAEFAGYAENRPEPWRLSYLRRLAAGGMLGDPNAPLIDVGVGGSGYTVIEAARAGSPAVGCDLSLAGLVTARRLAAEAGVADRTLWVCCTAERLPFASSTFASALAIAVIEHVPDDKAALSEIARVLRPEGRAWVTVPHALRNIAPVFRPANRRHDRRLGHLRRYEAELLAESGRRFGLEVVEVQFTGHAIKALQLAASKVLGGRIGERFWWWCEARDLRRSQRRRGSMQLSVLFSRAA